MSRGISLGAFGHATSLFLAITFVLCVGFDLVFPAHAMYQAWQRLLPGFTWITWSSFCARTGGSRSTHRHTGAHRSHGISRG